MRTPSARRCSLLSLALVTGCAGGALYPPRPPQSPGVAVVDPPPSRIVVHATVSSQGLRDYLDAVLPKTGEGTFPLSGPRRYTWTRGPLTIKLHDRRVELYADVEGTAEVPLLGTLRFPLQLRAAAEPVLSSDYQARLQGAVVEVSSSDLRLRAAQGAMGVLDSIRAQLQSLVDSYHYDLRPLVGEAYARVSRPLPLPLGDAEGCAELRVTSLESGPTVMADGLEKDLALIVAPSVTLPCAVPPPAPGAPPPMLPPLANVGAVPSGPFTVVVPIAARYEELAKAMSLAFTNGKLYFSKEFPSLYLDRPEVYSGQDQLVLRLHLGGLVTKGITTTLDGDIFFAGHPQVVDNELRIPDLEPTIETRDFLLKLKAALDASSIRDQARAALRLDLSDRLTAVRRKLSTDLAFTPTPSLTGAQAGCVRSDVLKIEVTGVYPHAGYLRVYVATTAQVAAYLPCPVAPLPAAAAPPTGAATPATPGATR